jgi:hypothetical protein
MNKPLRLPLLPDGGVRPYRPGTADFRKVLLQIGQSKEIEEHHRTVPLTLPLPGQP